MKDNSTVVTIHMVSSLNGLVSSVDDQLHEWMKSKYIYMISDESLQILTSPASSIVSTVISSERTPIGLLKN